MTTRDGYQLIALNASTGATRWTKTLTAGVSAAIVDGGGLFVADGDQITRFDGGTAPWSATVNGAFGDFVADPGHRLLVASKVTGTPSVSYVTAYDLAQRRREPGDAIVHRVVREPARRHGLLYFANYLVPGCTASTLHLDTAASGWSAPGEKLLAVDGARALLSAPGTGGGATDLVARNPTTGALIRA